MTPARPSEAEAIPPLPKVLRGIEKLSEWTGHLSGGLLFALVLLVCVDVVGRYLFNTGAVFIQELEWWLYSLSFLLGGAYTLRHNGHVRVDLLYSRLSPRKQHWIDLVGTVCLLFPFCYLVIVTGWDYTLLSWRFREGSPDPGGLPAYYLLKGVIVLGFVLIALQGAVEIVKHAYWLRYVDDEPPDAQPPDAQPPDVQSPNDEPPQAER